MPSVRVRRNTAPVAVANPPGRLRSQLTAAPDIPSSQDSTIERDGQGRAGSVESLDVKKDTRQEVVLGPPVAVAVGGLENAGSTSTQRIKNGILAKWQGFQGQSNTNTLSRNDASADGNPSHRQAASPGTGGRRGSEMAPPDSPRRRPRSRTIQAIFPPTEELVLRRSGMADLKEEPEPMSPRAAARPSTESRLSADERTQRAEAIARARGESITSTSGGAPVAIRLPERDRSQLGEAGVVVDAPEGGRRRSQSITLSLAAKTRRSAERARLSGDKSRSGSVTSGTGVSGRARARTVGVAGSGRGRADSVGLMSYFGLGNGVEAKMQSREDERRDVEKGVRGTKDGYTGGAGGLGSTEEVEEEEKQHHEDEVVEHLDVIGKRLIDGCFAHHTH